MKNLFCRMLSLLVAATLLFVLTASAEQDVPATPTDLVPAETQTEEAPVPEEESVPAETTEEKPAEKTQEPTEEKEAGETLEKAASEPEKEVNRSEEETGSSGEDQDRDESGSAEIIIKGTIGIGGNWNGTLHRKAPSVLKLDISREQPVDLLVEGKNIWTALQKSDRLTDDPSKVTTDPETDRLTMNWNAEAGSYLISLGPNEGSLMAKVKVTVMDETAFRTWEDAQQEEQEPEPETPQENEPETEPEVEPETEPEEEPVPEEETFELPADRNASISITWDDEYPDYGSVAHLKATLTGYDRLEYTLQWQWSPDNTIWTDVENATEDTLDVVYSRENDSYYWRIMVYVTLPAED